MKITWKRIKIYTTTFQSSLSLSIKILNQLSLIKRCQLSLIKRCAFYLELIHKSTWNLLNIEAGEFHLERERERERLAKSEKVIVRKSNLGSPFSSF